MKTVSTRSKKSVRLSSSKRLGALFKHPFFWTLTALGNSLILMGSIFLYLSEASAQPAPFEFIDSLLWSTSLVTTIGYGNHVPLTTSGKISVLVLMMLGTLFVWSYMAFVVTALISPALTTLEKDLDEVEREINELKQLEESIIKPHKDRK